MNHLMFLRISGCLLFLASSVASADYICRETTDPRFLSCQDKRTSQVEIMAQDDRRLLNQWQKEQQKAADQLDRDLFCLEMEQERQQRQYEQEWRHEERYYQQQYLDE